MHLDEYVARKGRGALERLRKKTELSYGTVFNASKRKPVKYETARRISLATGGEVSIAELCEPAPLSTAEAVAP